MTREAIIVDLDGTIFDTRHRLHYITGRDDQNWAAFEAAAENDIPVEHVVELLRNYAANGTRVLIVTARHDKRMRLATMNQLQRHQIPCHRLFMRPDKIEMDQDAFLKQKIYTAEIKPMYDVKFAIEDRPEVVQMWQRNGVPCFAVDQAEWAAQYKSAAWLAAIDEALVKFRDYYGSQANDTMAVRMLQELKDAGAPR